MYTFKDKNGTTIRFKSQKRREKDEQMIKMQRVKGINLDEVGRQEKAKNKIYECLRLGV